MRARAIAAAAAFFAGVWASEATAGPIAPGDFGPSPNLITFEGITNACSNVIPGRFPCGGAPWTIGDVTISNTLSWDLRNFGIGLGQSLAANEAQSDLTLQFATGFTKIGLNVVIGGRYDVSFFRGNGLLGTVQVVNAQLMSFGFAGWHDDLGIDRIRIVETVANNAVMAIDNIRWEGTPTVLPPQPPAPPAQVSTPGTLPLLAGGAVLLLAGLRRRR